MHGMTTGGCFADSCRSGLPGGFFHELLIDRAHGRLGDGGQHLSHVSSQRTALFSSGLQRMGAWSSASSRYVAFRCRCAQTNFPRFTCGATCRISSEKISGETGSARIAGFFACLAQGDGEQILLPVGVPAEPGPGLVEIVIGHQHLRPVRVYDPAGGGKVRRSVVRA